MWRIQWIHNGILHTVNRYDNSNGIYSKLVLASKYYQSCLQFDVQYFFHNCFLALHNNIKINVACVKNQQRK